MDAAAVLAKLRTMANPKNVEGMARFGIETKNTLGIFHGDPRRFAKRLGTDHAPAPDLWSTGIQAGRKEE